MRKLCRWGNWGRQRLHKLPYQCQSQNSRSNSRALCVTTADTASEEIQGVILNISLRGQNNYFTTTLLLYNVFLKSLLLQQRITTADVSPSFFWNSDLPQVIYFRHISFQMNVFLTLPPSLIPYPPHLALPCVCCLLDLHEDAPSCLHSSSPCYCLQLNWTSCFYLLLLFRSICSSNKIIGQLPQPEHCPWHSHEQLITLNGL